MTAFYATNCNSVVVSGGSGSSMVADGYIRTVEKIWMDTFTFSAVVTTADSICIAVIPGNKKITGVDVYLPTGIVPSSCTINVGVALPGTAGVLTTYCSILISNASVVLNSIAIGSSAGTTTYPKISMNTSPYAGITFPYVTTTSTLSVSGGTSILQDQTRVYMFLGVTAMTAPTAGTFTTIVRYT